MKKTCQAVTSYNNDITTVSEKLYSCEIKELRDVK